eukprot:SAG11_NODE_20360_length_447_cov_0.744253_1_plen_34_part_10
MWTTFLIVLGACISIAATQPAGCGPLRHVYGGMA